MKIDVAICTYQSEKYLNQCLTSIEKTVPTNKLIIIDHHSTDKTIEIAKKHNATIYFEDIGLAYARQLAIDHIQTPIFLFVDSDVVFHEKNWFPKAAALLGEKNKVGAVGIWTPSQLPKWRQRYAEYWWRNIRAIEQQKTGFVNSYLILKKAIEDIKIPSHLNAYEHIYIKHYIEKNGWTTTIATVDGIHYYDFPDEKGAWLGAGHRAFDGIKPLSRLLMRRIMTAPLKAIPPALAYNDPTIITKNTDYWIKYLKGWLQPEKYIKMKRK